LKIFVTEILKYYTTGRQAAGRKAKTVTNNLPILSVLGGVVFRFYLLRNIVKWSGLDDY
jgi:hypothetical protein